MIFRVLLVALALVSPLAFYPEALFEHEVSDMERLHIDVHRLEARVTWLQCKQSDATFCPASYSQQRRHEKGYR